MDSKAIIDAVRSVTKPWAKQRKAEERQRTRVDRRYDELTRTRRYSLKEAARLKIPAAYMAASDNGTLPANARQIMYAARGPIQAATGEELNDKYFTQSLLPEYLRDHPEETADWDVAFDARGHFHEPHTGLIVPLGTLDVRDYLSGPEKEPADSTQSPLFETHGPQHRFGAILFIEKEGFTPLFEAVKLAERHDIAIMSTKGMSVTAARSLVDRLCGKHDIPLLVLHDFDKSGFSILGSLQRDNHRYEFKNRIKVVDLGLRLEDVTKLRLASESVGVRPTIQFKRNLRLNGATTAEINFLAGGRRVELNAMTSSQLVEWIEGKLAEHGVKKVVPDDATLGQAYRGMLRDQQIQRRLKTIKSEAKRLADAATLPKALAKQIRAIQRADPVLPWDSALAKLVKRASVK